MFRKIQKLCMNWLLDPILCRSVSALARIQIWIHKVQVDIDQDERSKQWKVQAKAWDQTYENVKIAFNKD